MRGSRIPPTVPSYSEERREDGHSRSSGSGPPPGAWKPPAVCWRGLPRAPAWRSCWYSISTPGTRASFATCWPRSPACHVLEASQGLALRPDHVYVIPPNTSLTLEHGILQARTPRRSPRAAPADRSLLQVPGRGPPGRRDRRDPVGDRLRRHARSGGDQGRRAASPSPRTSFGQVSQHAAQRDRAAAASTSSCPPRRSRASWPGSAGIPMWHPPRRPGRPDGRPRGRRATSSESWPSLRSTVGVDFSDYRDTTIKRRILRRMVLQTGETSPNTRGSSNGTDPRSRRSTTTS